MVPICKYRLKRQNRNLSYRQMLKVEYLLLKETVHLPQHVILSEIAVL